MSVASLQLTMPKQTLHVSQENKAAYKNTFVNQVLSVDDFEGHFETILASLSNLNRMPLSGNERLGLTEGLINQYLLFIGQVRSRKITLPTKQATDLPKLNKEFAYATKLIARDAVAHSKEELANFVYWAVCSLCEQLNDFSALNRSQPKQLWAELNSLYQYAESRYLTDFHNNKPDSRDIDSRYKQAILFEAAQPEHLNLAEQSLIGSYLQKWAFRAQVLRFDTREPNPSYFYINLESESGVQSARQVKVTTDKENIRAINPLPIIEQTRQHMKQLRAGGAPSKIGFAENVDTIDAFMALKKALMVWKQSTSRRFERASCAIAGKTAFGLDTIHSYLRSPKAVADQLIATETINISKTGAAVTVEANHVSESVSVGDVVMHQQGDQNVAQLAVVRWLKRSADSIVFGVEFVVGNLQPVTVSVSDKMTQALLVSTSDNDSLITHKGYCTSNTPVRLSSLRHGIALNARAQSLMQRGENVDQIRLKRAQIG